MDGRFIPLVFLAGFAGINAGSPLDQCLKGPFKGITETAADGTVTGKADNRDWGCVDAVSGGVTLNSAADVPPIPPPTDICLYNAYPNPAENGVRIQFSIPASAAVRLTIYGENRGHGKPEAFPVRVLVDQNLVTGVHEVSWGLVDAQGARVPAGIYRAVLEVQGHVLFGDIEVR